MSPRILHLVLLFVSSVFSSKAQEQDKFIPFTKNSYQLSGQNNLPLRIRESPPLGDNILTTQNFQQNCFCSVYPAIVPLSKQGTVWTYQGIPNASCIPISTTFTRVAYTPGALSQNIDTCGVSNARYEWSITSGNNIAAITGSATGSTVAIAISNSGSFTLNLINTVTCNDSSSCTASTYYTDTVTIENCTCTAGPVTIQPGNKQGNVWTYQGSMQGTCTGQYGIPPNLTSCNVQNTTYSWSILAAGGVASISGPTNGQTVNVDINGNGPFTLRLDATITCNDGKTCTNYNFYSDSAKKDVPKNCTCDIDVNCERVSVEGNQRTYRGILKGGCTGEYGTSPPYLPCNTANVTWSWQVSSGNTVARIAGPDNQQTVNVQIIGTGAFELRVAADVTCNDGTDCGSDNFDYCQDSASVDKQCNFSFTESNLPVMAGGLSDEVKKQDKIRRDEFVALIAEAIDFDKVTIECTPSYQCDNSQKKSSSEVLLTGKVRFEWSIKSGEGGFVKLGVLPENATTDVGDRVIFQPPYVPLSKDGQTNSKTTVLTLTIIDETGAGLLKDEDINSTITIVTRRSANDADHYEIEIQSPDWSPPNINLLEDNDGVCKAAYGWDKPNDLQVPAIKLPAVPDNNKMVLGQWMILEADNQNETDLLKMVCESTECTDDGGQKEYPDNIVWTWTIADDDGKKGKFLGGNKGRYVIYAAPDSFQGNTTELSVTFNVEVKNTGVQLDDEPRKSQPLTITVFQPGVQLEYPPLDWVPKWIAVDRVPLKLKSYLLYKENGTWKEALAHMGRIHFFELLNVSQEKGICMNLPTPDIAARCRDLTLDDEDPQMEVFERPNDPGPFNCDGGNYYLHARSQKPKKEETVIILSEDQGSYGFLRSFANINKGGKDSIKGELPVYEPVPIPENRVAHPSGRKKAHNYLDNRVTIPRDVDENRISDGGWRTRGNVLMKDPINPQDDDDSELPGDGYPGDGLSNYEEYRGFLVDGDLIRTSIRSKDLFIYNPHGLNLGIFKAALTRGAGRDAVGVDVHEIRKSDYVDNETREINFNYNPQLHYLPVPGEPLRVQKGLWLIDGKKLDEAPGLLGQTYTAEERFKNINTPPNWVRGMAIFTDHIRRYAPRAGVNVGGLIIHVTTHELGHGIAMWHHGDSLLELNGLQSGDVNCIMRYDNIIPFNNPEPFGVIFCNDRRGTGNNGLPDCKVPVCYGDAAPKRGDCIHQFRISCRTINFPVR
jgi:hypothetical protein